MSAEDDKAMGDEDGWQRLEILTASPSEDGARLTTLGALGVEVQDRSTFMEGANFAPVPEGMTRLIAYFDADQPTDELRHHVEQSLSDVELISLASYRDRSWETAWMDYFEALDLSPHVSVGPPWDRPPQRDDRLALVIEPGMAFGTGSHGTTILCVQMLDDILSRRDVDSLIDVGCGSAILSMVAAGLGVERVVGIDIDATSIEVAQKNIEENGFTPSQIELSTRPLQQIDERFKVVVANILAPILLELRPALKSAVCRDGDLLLSGIPREQLDEVRDAFVDNEFKEMDARTKGEWAALHIRRHGEQ